MHVPGMNHQQIRSKDFVAKALIRCVLRLAAWSQAVDPELGVFWWFVAGW
jgi:hypothetical protein